ncbi:unnamed protein product [Phyllotreta striolata]|uniref:Gustatory receptor n=1 Tax=Phyllotreta striolata TaxID=444603 RepID=A0A9N9XQC0_PHYSR|nr:unnamed protein product [Phyllotreta striolata]
MDEPDRNSEPYNSLHHRNPHQRTNFQRQNLPVIEVETPTEDEMQITEAEILHYYDDFYHTTKSLLVLFQVMGVMPIERELGHTTYRWTSATNVWAYFIFAIETIFVSIVFQERLKLVLLPGKRFDEYVYAFIFLSILVPHFLLPLGAWTNGSEVAKFKNMWTKFQYKYYCVTKSKLVFKNFTVITYSLCVASWVIGIMVMLAQYYVQPDMLLWHTYAYYHILAMLNCLCSLWFINCMAKGQAARWLSQNLHNALQSSDPATRLSEYRDLWVDLSHMMQQLGKAYSGMYAMYCVLIILTTVVASYGCLTEILDHGLSFKEGGLFLISVYCMTLLFIICNAGHQTSNKMGPEFRERLLNVNLGAVDERTRQEVNMFLTAIDKNPPIMNLNGYANVNRKLISSVITSMATYLVMLMQFRLSLMRNAAIAAKRAAIANLTAHHT